MTYYFHAYQDKTGDIYIESTKMSYHEAMLELAENIELTDYAYTIEVDGDNIKKLDWNDEARAYLSNRPEYERLTGHEYGVCLGRV